MRKYILPQLLLLGLLVAADASSQSGKAPNFSFKDQNGETVELAKLKGNVVLVNFWATWCGPCRREMPDFVEAYSQYKSKGLVIVGISLDEEGWEVVRPFLKQYSINFPVVIGDEKVVRDYGNIQAIPTSFFIDRNGNIVDRHVGMMTKAMLEKKLKPLL